MVARYSCAQRPKVVRPSRGSIQSPRLRSVSISLDHRDAAVFVGKVRACIVPVASR
jgi:hypothetical protein